MVTHVPATVLGPLPQYWLRADGEDGLSWLEASEGYPLVRATAEANATRSGRLETSAFILESVLNLVGHSNGRCCIHSICIAFVKDSGPWGGRSQVANVSRNHQVYQLTTSVQQIAKVS